ncbi:hypothetical protein BGZ63DRAFT_386828 [Mariannaea sp. PMI_226]|nr:hypothetical protein BGZ63DRAFT_386828 [Mariannaea sp. PMI_226]
MAVDQVLSRSATALILLISLLPLVVAHGGSGRDDSMSMDMSGGGGHSNQSHQVDTPKDESEYPPSYFSHPDHVGAIYAHIALMTLAWVFILPIAVMLSLAKSRFTLIAQFVFLAANALGILVGTIYNASTPDLYPNNAHHKIGWIITWVVSAQVLITVVGWVPRVIQRSESQTPSDRQAFLPVSIHGARYHEQDGHQLSPYRHSDDSGHGTERNTASLRSNSLSTLDDVDDVPMQSHHKEYEDEEDDLEMMPVSPVTQKSALARHAAKLVTSSIWKYLDISARVINRIILPFGFIAFSTGILTFGRFFEGHATFSGLAHWIKGGVFFWLGLFTLGRWSGSFAELGWAWNVRPKKAGTKWRPSAEFVESFLIFFYGSTNIFLEHLAGWGGKWTATDMEHISITVLFIGGGMCGMLIESVRVRDLLNMTVDLPEANSHHNDEETGHSQPPDTYKFSLNPIPALVIMLLGVMMSSHTQHNMISGMVHKQWGNLLFGASCARGFTYVLMFLKPPKSSLPSRPPTELLASFGLISGGIIFMASAGDTVEGMIHYELDAMFMYTVTMGLVALLMAWEIIVLAIKGWAVRRERRCASQ